MLCPSSTAIKAALLSACLVSHTHAHLIMASPVPYGHATIDNSPLTSANYPCKVTSDPATFYATAGIDNTYAAGSTQTLSFTGSATHGGGSCQLALSSDMQPSASTDWRVILSIEGGCPTTDLTGASGASTYNWTVPATLTPGSYSFAWTWISKQAGQAEYYMNCAPITVTAPSAASKRDTTADDERIRRDDVSYPELFVANLADINSCETTEGSDYVYPYGGGAVENLGVPAASLKYTTIASASCVPKGQTEGGNYLPTAAGAAAAVASSAAASSSSAPATGGGGGASSSSASMPGGVVLTSGASAPAPTATTLVTATAVVAATTTSETVYVSPIKPKTSTRTGQAASSATTEVSPGGVGEPSSTVSSVQATATSSTVLSSSVVLSSSILSPSVASPTSSALPSLSTLSTSTLLSSTSSAAATPSPSIASTTPSSSSTPTATGSGATPTGSSSAGSTMRGTCTEEGMFNCVGSQYQQCASGGWTSMQALPAGTTCTQGLSTGLWARRVGPDGLVRRGRRNGRGSLY